MSATWAFDLAESYSVKTQSVLILVAALTGFKSMVQTKIRHALITMSVSMRIFANQTPYVRILTEATVVPAKLDSKEKLVRILMSVLQVIVMKMQIVEIQKEATNAVVEKAIMDQV